MGATMFEPEQPEEREPDLPGYPLVLLGVFTVLALGVAFVVFLASRALG